MGRSPSRMELEVAQELQRRGLRFKTQVPVPVTTADFEVFRPDGESVLVFLDGEAVHRNRRDRDAEVRRLLAERGREVLEVGYKAYGKKAREEAVSRILEAVGP